MSRRSRANSFRGKEMHQDIRGHTDVVGDARRPPPLDLKGIPPAVRICDTPRQTSTPTLRESIEQKVTELALTPEEMQTIPPITDINEFQAFVDVLDNDPSQFEKYKAELSSDRLRSIERTLVRMFCIFDRKDTNHEKLTPSEFQMKCIVDDLLVRLFNYVSQDVVVGYPFAPSPLPGPSTFVESELIPGDPDREGPETGDCSPQDFMPGGILGTKPVVHVTPLPAKMVLSGSSDVPHS